MPVMTRGFSLLEVLISMAISSVLLLGVRKSTQPVTQRRVAGLASDISTSKQ